MIPYHLDNPPQSLCVLRLSAIGDVCHAVAVIQLLQRTWPQTKITWVIGKVEATLLCDLPGIEFLIYDKKADFKNQLAFWKNLRQRQFDVLLHMQVALRASLLSLGIRAKYRIGFDKARAKDGQWLFTREKIRAIPRQHVLEGFLEFAKVLGVPSQELTWQVPLSESDLTFAEKYCQEKPVLVINPCASKTDRNWLTGSYAKVAAFAVKELGYQVLLTGGPSETEKALGQEIVDSCPEKIVNLIGKTNLKQLLALLMKAKVLIAPDTGPAHMATLVNTPVIGLYARSNPLRTGPFKSQQWVINRYPQALKQTQNKEVGEVPWGMRLKGGDLMALITVEDVISVLRQVKLN